MTKEILWILVFFCLGMGTICFEGYVESRERLEVAMWHAHKDYVEREMGE